MKKHQLPVDGFLYFSYIHNSNFSTLALIQYHLENNITWTLAILLQVCSISLVLRNDNMHVICYEQDKELKLHVVYIGRSQYHKFPRNTICIFSWNSVAYIICICNEFACWRIILVLYQSYHAELTSIYVHHVICNGDMLLFKIIYSHVHDLYVQIPT